MNAERLRGLADYLLHANNRLGLANKLNELRAQLDNLTNSPGDPNIQASVTKALDALETAYTQLDDELSPALEQSLRELGAWPYFSRDLPGGIRSFLSSNGVTPGPVRDRVAQLFSQRQEFISRLEDVVRGLDALGIREEVGRPGSAELGFLIPRDLFNNSLRGLSAELSQLTKIIAVFSELATGSVEEVELHQISASDPLIFLGMDVRTVAMLAGAITWLLNTWKQALEVRQLHINAKALELPAKLLDQLQNQIDQKIETEIAKHAETLVSAISDAGRRNELQISAKRALHLMLAKIERGMTVEVKFLPPPTGDVDGPASATPDANKAAFQRLAIVRKELVFPAIEGEPLIQLDGPASSEASAEGAAEHPASHQGVPDAQPGE